MQASGRNAGLLRQSSDDPEIAALLQRGARAARRALREVPGSIRRTGSLILGRGIGRLAAGPNARVVDASEVVRGLEGSALYTGWWSEWSSDPSRPIETGPAGTGRGRS